MASAARLAPSCPAGLRGGGDSCQRPSLTASQLTFGGCKPEPRKIPPPLTPIPTPPRAHPDRSSCRYSGRSSARSAGDVSTAHAPRSRSRSRCSRGLAGIRVKNSQKWVNSLSAQKFLTTLCRSSMRVRDRLHVCASPWSSRVARITRSCVLPCGLGSYVGTTDR